MDAGLATTGALYVGACAAVARWPYRIARFSDQLYSRGSTHDWCEVEPTPVLVRFTRILAVLAVPFGLLGAVGTLLG